MRKYAGLFALCLLVVCTFPAEAAVVEGGQDYYLAPGGIVDDDLYVFGGNIGVNGGVTGDLIAAGGNISVTGKITQDAQLAGGNLRLEGPIGDDLRAAGGMVFVNSAVNGDAFLAGAQVTTGPGSDLRGGVWIAGRDVVVQGSVAGDAWIAGEKVIVNGRVQRINVRANVLEIGRNAIIEGPLTYSAPREAAIAPEAQVRQGIVFNRTEQFPRVSPAAVFSIFWFFKALAVIAAALLFYWLFRNWTMYFTRKVAGDFGYDLVRGLVLVFIIPIFSTIALATVVLLIPGVIGLLSYGLLIAVAMVFSGIVLGSVAAKYIFRKADFDVNWKTVIFGVLAIQVIGLIPFLGWLVSFIFFLPPFGGLYHLLYLRAWKGRSAAPAAG